jgi:hypothetical protein
MGNSASSAATMMVAKNKMNAVLGDQGTDTTPTEAPALRKTIAEQRKERDAEYEKTKADRAAKKGNMAKMWSENKAAANRS